METGVVITHYIVGKMERPLGSCDCTYHRKLYDTLRNVYMHDVIECICLFI
jgi:hypothetical protein